MTTNRTDLCITGVRAAIEEGKLSAEALIQQCLQTVDEQSALNAFITPPRSPSQLEPSAGPLGGTPIAVKDNICTEQFRTTAGSRILENYRPVEDAEVVAKLRRAGAVVFGKTNLDEFGMGASTEHSHFGPTLHPVDSNLVPGGSSGGSAVCVAADICPAALGSDTGGSVRQPASFCGVVGFKPTWGRVSRRGLIAFASSLDQVGWMTRTVEDAAVLFDVLAGFDPLDATSSSRSADSGEYLATDVEWRDFTVGVPEDWIASVEIEPAVREGFEEYCQQLRDSGVRLVEVELPHIDLATPAYQVIATAEASSNLARYDGIRYGRRADADTLDELYRRSRTEGFGREVKRRILLGAYTLSEGYVEKYFEQACRVRRAVIDDFRREFSRLDAIITPTTPSTAFRRGERVGPLDAYSEDVFTIPASLAGLPAISVPAGRDDAGLPFGVQVFAAPFDEAKVFALAAGGGR